MPNEFHPQMPEPPVSQTAGNSSWVEHLLDLANSRIALFQLEAKQAASRSICRVVMIAAAAFAACVAWLLLMSGIVGILHTYAGFPWYWSCLALGGVHLLVIAALLRSARTPGPAAFQQTRSEFQKDREWLQSLQHPKSKP